MYLWVDGCFWWSGLYLSGFSGSPLCFHGPRFTLLPAAQNSSMGSRLWVLSFFLLPHLLLLSLLVLGAVLHWTFFRFLNFPSSSGHRAFTYILPTARGLSLRPAASSGNTLLIALELHQLWSPPTSDFGRFLCPQLLWTGGFCFPSLHSLKSDGWALTWEWILLKSISFTRLKALRSRD